MNKVRWAEGESSSGQRVNKPGSGLADLLSRTRYLFTVSSPATQQGGPTGPGSGLNGQNGQAQPQHMHAQAHPHRHHITHTHRSSRARPRSVSRSSSSPSPPPSAPKAMGSSTRGEKRRSFSSRSPGGIVNRRQSKISAYESSPLHASTSAYPNSGSGLHTGYPGHSLAVEETEAGFSTQYGASASSPGLATASEREDDRYLGDETEVDNRKRKRTSGDSASLANWASSKNASDPALEERK